MHPTRDGVARAAVTAAVGLVLLGQAPSRSMACPEGAVLIGQEYCIDRYEASLDEVLPNGEHRHWPPVAPPLGNRRYAAASRRGVLPQGYASQHLARAACAEAGKRLCTEAEWSRACRGPDDTVYPYGSTRARDACNDARPNPVPRLFPGPHPFRGGRMLDPRLNTLPDTLAATGTFAECTNAFGVYDMVGNLHEWIDARWGSHGVFRGGYYADARINGAGCAYTTRAHAPDYRDYSIGFRCCADPR